MQQLALIVGILLLGCSPQPVDILSHPLHSGRTLGEQLPADSSSVVLVIAQADLAVCGNHVSRWIEWRRSNPGRLSIVLKKAPDPAGQKQLLMFRIRPDAVLAASHAASELPTPHEYLVVHGRVVFSEAISAGAPESALLKAFEGGQGQVALLLKEKSRSVP
jgi:hypothetical protein